MNRYILIRRLRGPSILLLIGVLALLHQAGVVYHFWHLFWPLALILWGVLMLAERAALEVDGYPQFTPGPYPGQPGPGPGPGSGQGGPYGGPMPPTTSTSIVPASPDDLERGGQS